MVTTLSSLTRVTAAALTLLGAAALPAQAEKQYGPGVSDTEILVGQNAPFSGPASSYATISKVAAAYFEKINAEGGINGRKIRLLSRDDGYSPPKALEQIRRLVEQDGVFAIYNPFGTAPNSAIQKYLNAKQVPQLFLSSGSERFNDPERYPWTMPWLPTYRVEGRSIAKYIMAQKPDARIAILYQNDDIGKDYVDGIREGLGERADRMIVAQSSYEVSDPTVDSEIVKLKASGADTFLNLAIPKFAAQAIKKSHDIGWKPFHYVASLSASIASVLKPAGVEKSLGVITGAYVRDPHDPATQQTEGYKAFAAFMQKYYPEGDIKDGNNLIGYSIAQTFVQVIRQAGDNLTRENVMREAANLKGLELPMLLPGLVIDTGPNDYLPLEDTRLMRFDGANWVMLEQ